MAYSMHSDNVYSCTGSIRQSHVEEVNINLFSDAHPLSHIKPKTPADQQTLKLYGKRIRTDIVTHRPQAIPNRQSRSLATVPAFTRYVKLWVAHAPGMPGTFFSRDSGLSIPTCIMAVTHLLWCMPGLLSDDLLWNRWRGKRSRHSRCMRNPQIYVSGKRPMPPLTDLPSLSLPLMLTTTPFSAMVMFTNPKRSSPNGMAQLTKHFVNHTTDISFAVWNLKRRGKFNDTWAHDGRIKTCTRRMKWLHWDYVCYWMICLKHIVPIV